MKKAFLIKFAQDFKAKILESKPCHSAPNGIQIIKTGENEPVTPEEKQILSTNYSNDLTTPKNELKKINEFKSKWTLKRDVYIPPDEHINKLYEEGWDVDKVFFLYEGTQMLVLCFKKDIK